MNFTDTHTHLYVEEFNDDREAVVRNAIEKGVNRMLLPNIDTASIQDMLDLVAMFPEHCFPMMGLHPTSVDEEFENSLMWVEQQIEYKQNYFGVGEIGIDLYWDTFFREHQIEAFKRQLQLAKKYGIPVSIHTRNAFDLTLRIVKEELNNDLRGVFHCFTGTIDQAQKVIDMGFKLGIGGIVTFKNAGLDQVVASIPLKHLVLETDAPYLSPVPFRGKRNQSAYLTYIADKIANIKSLSLQYIAEVTDNTVDQLFFKS